MRYCTIPTITTDFLNFLIFCDFYGGVVNRLCLSDCMHRMHAEKKR